MGTNEWERELDGLCRRSSSEEDGGRRRKDRSTFLEKEGWSEGRRGGDSNREWTHAHKTPERYILQKPHSVCRGEGCSEMRRGTSQARIRKQRGISDNAAESGISGLNNRAVNK